MSLRRSRKRRTIAGIALARILPTRNAIKAVAATKAAKKGAKAVAATKAAKGAGKAAKRASRVRAIAVLVLAGGAVVALRRRRAQQREADFGPPNESVPSHEALAGAREAAGRPA